MEQFLVWKDRKGKTTVHKSACQFFGRKGSFSCLCPTRLAYGTVDSLIGKLRALFNESGRRGEWDPRLLISNPATDISLKQYLKAVTAEQLQAQITPTQATPVFVHDLVRLSHFLDEKLLSDKLSSIEMFVLMRDQASFKTLFFSGDRAGDLGQVKTPGNPPFPHIWGKPSVMAHPTFLAYAVVSIQTFDLYVTLRAVFCFVLRLQMAPLLTNLFPPRLRMPVSSITCARARLAELYHSTRFQIWLCYNPCSLRHRASRYNGPC